MFLTRGEVTDVTRDADGRLTVTARTPWPGEHIQVKVDLVVLAAGMVPNSADGEAIRAFEDAKTAAEKGESETQRERGRGKGSRAQASRGNRDTQPRLSSRSRSAHASSTVFRTPISFASPTKAGAPESTPPDAVRQPMDGLGSREDGAGAALKAIQCVEMTSRGEAVHPRAGDKSYPDFFLQRCTQCKRCTEECPFGVLNEDEKGTPLLRATRCRRCGVCMGACPERIVSFKDYSVDIVGVHDQSGRGAGRVRGKAADTGVPVRERRLSGPGSGGAAPSPGAVPSFGSSRCDAWDRSMPSGSRRPSRPDSTESC